MLPDLNCEDPLPHFKIGGTWNFRLVSHSGIPRLREKALKWISRLDSDSHRRSILHQIKNG